MTLSDKIFDYTWEHCGKQDSDVDPIALRKGIEKHLNDALSVVTQTTLDKLGAQHLSVMISTASLYSLTLGEVLLEGTIKGCGPVSTVCSSLRSRKKAATRIKKKPALRIVKTDL